MRRLCAPISAKGGKQQTSAGQPVSVVAGFPTVSECNLRTESAKPTLTAHFSFLGLICPNLWDAVTHGTQLVVKNNHTREMKT